MRYDNWDAILFPRDSHVPIQEFRTACYVAQDEYGRPTPTLTSYIASLPAATPFRVSIHSWANKAKPSPLIESRRKPHQRVVYSLSVVVDGTRLFHDFFEVSGKWPQEVVHEKRSVILPPHPPGQQRPPLEFPPFRHNVLMQSCWDAREDSGRIKVLLSEQLVGKSNGSGDVELGASNDIVCFLFQHAPRDILEQAGIAWPIRNPLYLPSLSDIRPAIAPGVAPFLAFPDAPRDYRIPSPQLKGFKSPTARSHVTEPGPRPNTAPIPSVSPLRKAPQSARSRARHDFWDDAFTESFGDSYEDISMMDTWSTRRTDSTSTRPTTDASMPDILSASPRSTKPRDARNNQHKYQGQNKKKSWNDIMQGSADEDKHVLVTFREDQLGRLVEAFSPPKPPRGNEHNMHCYMPGPGPFNPAHGYPAKVANMGTRPSAAALARTASYPNLNAARFSKMSPPKHNDRTGPQSYRNSPHVPLSAGAPKGKENRDPSESRVPTPFPFDPRQPHPMMQFPMWGPVYGRGGGAPWESDTEMRDPSSMFSSLSRYEKPPAPPTGKESPAPVPSAHGSIKSRKEGLTHGSPSITNLNIRHDKSILQPLDPAKQSPTQTATAPHTTELCNANSQAPQHTDNVNVNVIDVDEPKVFVPGHRSGMSSMERVETELFSALGEEFNTLSQMPGPATATGDHVDMTGLEEFESPVMKRKRGGSVGGGDAERSPHRKMLREGVGDGGAQGQASPMG